MKQSDGQLGWPLAGSSQPAIWALHRIRGNHKTVWPDLAKALILGGNRARDFTRQAESRNLISSEWIRMSRDTLRSATTGRTKLSKETATSTSRPTVHATGYLRVGLWLFALIAMSTPGCSWFSPRVSLPASNQIEQDELLIHCDFDLPQRHRLLQSLSQLRSQLHEKLALAPTGEAIHVYLFDDQAKFAKYMQKTHPDFPQRRAFFVKDDAKLTVYAHWGERVAVDLRHEVAHGYLHAATRNLPLWLDEGLAEYFEVAPSEQGINQPHVELLRKRYEEGTWRPDLAALENLTSPAQMQQIDYAESWLWAHWMLETSPTHLWQLQGYVAARNQGDLSQPLAASDLGSDESHQQIVAHLFGAFP